MYQTFSRNETGAYRTHVVHFKAPVSLAQIRIPRSNSSVHVLLSKLEAYFLENNFILEIFALEEGRECFGLLFSEKISTEKIIQDLIIPVEPPRRIIRAVFRGNFGTIPVALYSYTKETNTKTKPRISPPPIEENNLKPDSFHTYYSKLRLSYQNRGAIQDSSAGLYISSPPPAEWLRPHYLAIRFSPEDKLGILNNIVFARVGNVINYANITPNLLFSKVADDIKDDENSQLLLMKLEDEVNGLQTFLASPKLLENDQNILLYMEALNDTCIMIYQFMEKNRSLQSEPYFLEDNLEKNNDLSPLIVDVLEQSIYGQVDYENEMTSAIALLIMMLNSSKHSEKLMNPEFLRQLLKIGFGSGSKGFKLVNLFHQCFHWLCYNKKFRTAIASPAFKKFLSKDISFRLKLESKMQGDSADLSKRSRLNSSSSDDERELAKAKVERKEKRSKRDKRPRESSERLSKNKEKKDKKDKSKRERKESPQDKRHDKDSRRKEKKSKTDKGKGERSASRKADKKKKKPASNSKADPERRSSDNLLTIYHRNLKSILESETMYFFNKHRIEHFVLSLGEYLEGFQKLVKSMVSFKLEFGSLLLHFERSFFYLKKIWKLIRNIVEESKEETHINTKLVDQLKGSVREVFQSSGDIYETLLKQSQNRSYTITNALANFLIEENFFELLIVLLSNVYFKSSDFYETTLSTACRMLLYILNCNGGACLILKNKAFMKDLLRFLKMEMERSSHAAFDFSENDFNQLSVNDSSVFGKHLYISPEFAQRCFNNPDEGKATRIAAVTAQYYYLFENIVAAIGKIDNLYSSLLSLGNEHDILLHLLQIVQMFETSLLSAQAICIVLKEEYFFETLMIILKVDSVELYEKVRQEIAIVCKILFLFLLKSSASISFTKFSSLKEVLRNLEKIISTYCAVNPHHLREKVYTELDRYLTSLRIVLEPFEKLKEDYNSFITGLQSCSRYTHTNINTLLSNKQHFLNVEREFPRNDKKKYFGRLNDYLSFFKTFSSKDNQILPSVSYLKAIKFCLESNSTAFLFFVNSNIFDITNFLVLVSEMVIGCFLGMGGLSREIQLTYLSQSTEILRNYITMFNYGLQILYSKTNFKEQLEGHGKEYENVDLFLALINFVITMKDVKPNYFYELCIKKVFELEEYYNTPFLPMKSPYKKHKYMIKFQSFCYSKESSSQTTFIDSETKSAIIDIINTCIEMFAVWGKFPGSYDVLLSEILFLIFSKHINREVYFILLAVFINEPRKSANKEKIRKIIHTLLFEKVRTLKKSKLILIQKHGSIRSDSLFDIFVTQNGYSTTIEYLIHTYLLTMNKELFFSFGFCLMTLIEWKDVGFSSLISSSILSIYTAIMDLFVTLYNKADFYKLAQKSHMHDENDSAYNELVEESIQTLKHLGKALEMINLLCLTGIFKIYLIEADITKSVFAFLSFKISSTPFASHPVHQYYLLVKLEFMKLLNILMDEDIGFAYKEKDSLEEDKFFSEVISLEDMKALIKLTNKELRVPASFLSEKAEDMQGGSVENTQAEIFKHSLELLKKLSSNPVSKNICAYGNYSKILKKFKKPVLKLKYLTRFIYKCLDSDTQENKTEDAARDVNPEEPPPEETHDNGPANATDTNATKPKAQSHGAMEIENAEFDNDKRTSIKNSNAGHNDHARENKYPINETTASKIASVIDAYLQSVFTLVTHTIEDCFLFTNSRLQALTQIVSEKQGLESWQLKMHSVIDKLKRFNLRQDQIVRIELCLYCLTVYKKEFEEEKKEFERHIDIPEKFEIKVRLQKYNKSYFRFEPGLDELSKRRNFLVNIFQYTDSVLENKFKRNSKHKNFCRISFTRKIEYFFGIKCKLTRLPRIRQSLPEQNSYCVFPFNQRQVCRLLC